MSTLKVDNIQATGETATRAVSGVAAAEIKYNTSSNVVSGSVNVSSTTDINSAADTISLTSAMSNATYRIVGAANGSDTAYNNGRWIAPYSYAASSFNIASQSATATLTSSTAMNVVIHGDLA